MKHVVWISDFDLSGSGYLNISLPLCNGISDEYEVKAIGLGYRGQEHANNFGIIPAQNLGDGLVILQNLVNMWGVDYLVVALDIPVQVDLLKAVQENKPFKYIGIMPVEADPLCLTWAMSLMQMDKVFIISEFGANEAKKFSVEAEHLVIGIDSETWRIPDDTVIDKVRKSLLGVDDDCFVILYVGDNQERKHLSRMMEIFSDFSKEVINSRLVLVTRENFPFGWKLRDLAQELGINDKLMIFPRGLNFMELWSLYAASDAFMLTSKAEGLGMPLLEAMSTGVPCLGTDCTAISELLGEGRGFLMKPDYVYRDPFGNGRRYFVSRKEGVDKLLYLYKNDVSENVNLSRAYVENRPWSATVKQLKSALKAFENEQKE